MKPETILQANLLDIIFNDRNKLYGAYELRKNYSGRLYSSLAIILFLMIVFSVWCLTDKNSAAIVDRAIETTWGHAPPDPQKPKEIVPLQKPADKPNKGDDYTRIQFVDSLQAVEPIEHPDSIGNSTNISLVTPGGGIPGAPFEGVDTIANVPQQIIKPVDRNIPVDIVDVWPEYPGGMSELAKYFKRNLQTPDDLEEGQVVSVYVKFIVGYDGILKDFEIIKDGGAVFNKEVLRVLKKMKPWKPGISKGEKVSVYYTIPVKFVAQE